LCYVNNKIFAKAKKVSEHASKKKDHNHIALFAILIIAMHTK